MTVSKQRGLNEAQREERRDQVMSLLLRGETLRSVAGQLHVSHRTVLKDRDARLKQLAKDNPAPLHYREIQVSRLERMLQVAMPLALGRDEEVDADGIVTAPPMAPDPIFFDRAIRIIERLSVLYGLDSQDVINVNVQQWPSAITVKHTPGAVPAQIIDAGKVRLDEATEA